MSTELFEVLSLAARYLFALLGVLIVLRAFLWLLSDRSETRSARRRMRDSGFIGELVVLSGSPALREGTVIPVPWEGCLGSVRSCDVAVPCPGVRRQHLWFSFESGAGLSIQPCSGCQVLVDQNPVDCRSWRASPPMGHGSFLQIGSALLRLRIFAGLDSAAGFPEEESFAPAAGPSPAEGCPPPSAVPLPPYPPAGMPYGPGPRQSPAPEAPFFQPPFPAPGPSLPNENGYYAPEGGPAGISSSEMPGAPAPLPAPEDIRPEEAAGDIKPRRRRRSERRNDRWEEDWSE